MLMPTKHSHPDATVIAVSAQILKRLRKNRLVPFEQLKSEIRSTHSGADVLLVPALDLLFLLGIVSYRSKTDAFEYQGP
jgi:hypothetical protein